MKICQFLVFVLLQKIICSEEPPKKKEESEEKPKECNLNLMRTYMLKGRAISSLTEPNIVCPKLKSNCCIKLDQQRIYHYVNNVLPLRLNEHKDRLRFAFVKLKKFHHKIIKSVVPFVGGEEKIAFCNREKRQLMTYDFALLDNQLE